MKGGEIAWKEISVCNALFSVIVESQATTIQGNFENNQKEFKINKHFTEIRIYINWVGHCWINKAKTTQNVQNFKLINPILSIGTHLHLVKENILHKLAMNKYKRSIN